VRPIAPLNIMASVSLATADKKPVGFLNSAYGWGIDVVGTYKITNKLSYMLGVGYLFTMITLKAPMMPIPSGTIS
jgi:hypothetical protein